jgi:hypothetical protein
MYFTPGNIAKLGAEDSEVLARCMGVLMGSHTASLKKAKASKAAQRTATLLLLHPAAAVRAAARGALDAAAEAGTVGSDR